MHISYHLIFLTHPGLKFVDGGKETKRQYWESVVPHLWEHGPAAHARMCFHSRARNVVDSSDNYYFRENASASLCYNTHNEMSFLHH